MGYTPPQLEVRKITGGYQMFPPTLSSGDDLTINANGTDTYSYLKLNGNSGFFIGHPTGGNVLIYDATTLYATIGYTTPDLYLRSGTDKNIYLQTVGTGVVKFGTFTGSGDVACNGSIAILDSAGNARKLMTTA